MKSKNVCICGTSLFDEQLGKNVTLTFVHFSREFSLLHKPIAQVVKD